MSQTHQMAASRKAEPLPSPSRPRLVAAAPPPLSRREQGRRLRAIFLQRFRTCGEVKLAAEQAGIAHATLYRWRARDENFRERWDSVADQRRFDLEDKLMRLVHEGEKSAVFHKGEQVGWRVSHTVRPVLAMLAYLDRREKLRIEEEKRASESHFSSVDRGKNAQSAGLDDDDAYDDDAHDEEAPDEVRDGTRDGARDGGVGEEDDADEEDVDEVEEVAGEDDDDEEVADIGSESVRSGAPSVPQPAAGGIWVRIVQPYFDNVVVHEPGAIIEIPDRCAFSRQAMEELKPGEVVPTPPLRKFNSRRQ